MTFVSFAQNREDVVLQRALRDVTTGTYVEVGANHPTIESISRSFYDRGWSGLAIEPNPAFAAAFREERPRDTVLEAAITEHGEGTVTLHVIPDTGLSTLVDDVSRRHAEHGWTVEDVAVPTVRLDRAIEEAGLAGRAIHFLMVDVEGAELTVLRSIDLRRIRPWILVIEAVQPLSEIPSHAAWEPIVLDAGYRLCLFDGLSRFYVAEEMAGELQGPLSYSASILDDYTTRIERDLSIELAHFKNEAAAYQRQIEDMRQSHSWRLTRPLRTLGSAIHRTGPVSPARSTD